MPPLVPVFEVDMALAFARGSGTAAVWNGVRDVVKFLEQPVVREMSAADAAALIRESFERETGETC